MSIDPELAALCSIPELGPVTQRRIIGAMGSAGAALSAGVRKLRAIEGVTEKRACAVAEFEGTEDVVRKLQELERQGVSTVAEGDPGYPAWLTDLGPEAPLVLYVRGEVQEDDRAAVAIVGSRTATDYGKTVTEKIASELAVAGLTVVSGLARGIDTRAHRGALDAGGRTIGILGSGIDVPYPPENRGLMDRTARQGAVISEFPPGMSPLPGNFPRRNRLISALSLGVLVVEAAGRSGSLITARYALEQGREVFAVPGNVSSRASQGTNELIKQGARVVTSADDIIEELAIQLKGFLKERKKKGPAGLTVEEKALCDIMGAEPSHIDDILRNSGIPAPQAMSLLMGLELKGIIKQLEGKRYYLA